ncbi:uncharacterized protein N7515_004857 [Penicillium bovifimosum]|uniref:Uncharacterized protein n=1 Tax=Penicillium bovifimosum TaxID=126998 RepID=A0A9W9H0X0_9EURO|nr:uncharacterized protein N7515_004857 [Penicillium bovifimosum]KAJ5135579.1 hypothetical protein N7515_004857 [Penicillium bovifimosum]
MALRTSAKNAEDVAAAFTQFRDPIPEHAAEVTALIADLFAISSSLSALEALNSNFRYRRDVALIQPDLNLLLASLKYTLEDIVDYFQVLDPGKSLPGDYMRTWLDLNRFFWDESRYSLATRFAKYKAMLRELNGLATNNYHDPRAFASLQENMKTLLSIQDNRLASRLGRMNLGRTPSNSSSSAGPPSSPISDRRPGRRRSYERTRPGKRPPTGPMSSSSATTFSDTPPSVPEPPSSPRTSATAGSARSGVSDVIRDHWCKEVFRTNTTSTPLRSVDAMNDVSEMTVSFWLHPMNHRARILCKVPDRSRVIHAEDPRRRRYPSDYYCLPLNMLELMRDPSGSCLRLCRRRDGGRELVLWTLLRFSTLENLVFFHGTFLALRSQDAGVEFTKILDYHLDQEKELFGGKITDDGYKHALRVYRDRVTGAVRLQASVLDGEMKRTPVWIAFITHNLHKPNWFKHPDRRTFVLRDTWPVVFMDADAYALPQTQGCPTLTFTESEDAKAFLMLLDKLAEPDSRR